ncbi:hypothetical protein N7510_000257 [Penicillium lagena]|uniref:uncharacterized protein n=1 Tax=Penicillium lagena TaxID=94218 RepID=UPI002540B63A|nr:uncharacterized protein N7510_000257 [Penicillium lagena]KAJ5623948.1 hypothetical protein N7510_000257 [Penicillium lagena]
MLQRDSGCRDVLPIFTFGYLYAAVLQQYEIHAIDKFTGFRDVRYSILALKPYTLTQVSGADFWAGGKDLFRKGRHYTR